MTASNEKTLTGELYDDGSEITVIELCRVCAVDAQLVDELIAEGILEPTSSSAGTTVLPYSSIRRTRTVIRMQRDLGCCRTAAFGEREPSFECNEIWA